MALNLPSGGDYNPWIRWAASETKFVIGGENGNVDYVVDEVIIDFENLKTGWGLLGEGQAPTWIWNPSIDKPSEKPDDRSWKPGVGVTLFFGDDGAFEMETNAVGAVMGIDEAHDAYLKDLDANKDKVPVFKFTGQRFCKVGKGQTNIPEFSLVKWIERPDALKEDAKKEPAKEEEAAPAESKAAAGGGSQF